MSELESDDGVSIRSMIDEISAEREETVAVLDGLDDAIIGYSDDLDGNMHVVYSVDKCISIFTERDGMSREEAVEFYSYNTERVIPYTASVGNVPIMVKGI